MRTSYLDLVRLGKNDWWRYLVGVIVILVFWFGLGSVFILALLFWSVAETGGNLPTPENMFPGVPPPIVGLFILLSFVPLLVGVLLVVRYIHQRPILSLLTARPRFDWGRMAQGFVIYGMLILLAALAEALIYPGRYQFALNVSQFLPFLLIGLIFIPIQTTAEELLFRGYILQWLSLLTKQPLVLAVINGLLFMLPHLANPEVEASPWLMAANFFIVGFALAFITIRDNGLELAIGIHVINNLFSLVVNYPESSLPVESIFTVTFLDPAYSLVSITIVYAVFYVLVFRGRPPQPAQATGQERAWSE